VTPRTCPRCRQSTCLARRGDVEVERAVDDPPEVRVARHLAALGDAEGAVAVIGRRIGLGVLEEAVAVGLAGERPGGVVPFGGDIGTTGNGERLALAQRRLLEVEKATGS
jgi:hypothetical protein